MYNILHKAIHSIYVTLNTALPNLSLLPSCIYGLTFSDLCMNQNTHGTQCGGWELTEIFLQKHYDSMALYVHRNWTAASYCSSVFQLQNLIPFIKKSNCTKYRHRTACCYCTLCSNVILTAAVYCHQLVSEHNVKWHLSPSSLTVSFVHCIIVTFWMAMLTVFGGHFVVRHYTEDTCIGVCCGL